MKNFETISDRELLELAYQKLKNRALKMEFEIMKKGNQSWSDVGEFLKMVLQLDEILCELNDLNNRGE